MSAAVDWRRLLSQLNVPWVDRGKNTSAGHISIKCPFCHDDPSQHLSVREDTGYYSCWRNGQHRGSAEYLLQRIIGNRVQAIALLEDFKDDRASQERSIPPPAYTWERFTPAYLNAMARSYLISRGFNHPEKVARDADLRVAEEGQWALRLLFPLYDPEGLVRSWSGRAMLPHLEQRYLVNQVVKGDELLAGAFGTDVSILVEGPADALKINAGSKEASLPISALALQGLALTPGRLFCLNRLASKAATVFLCLDDAVALSIRIGMIATLRQFLPYAKVLPLKLPDGVEDAGDLTTEETINWLQESMNVLRRPMERPV